MAGARRALCALSRHKERALKAEPLGQVTQAAKRFGVQEQASCEQWDCQGPHNDDLHAGSKSKSSVLQETPEGKLPRGVAHRGTAVANSKYVLEPQAFKAMIPLPLTQLISWQSCRMSMRVGARPYRRDGGPSFRLHRCQPSRPPSDFSNENGGFASGFSTKPSSPSSLQNLLSSDKPPPPNSPQHTLWYGAIAALFLAGGATVAANVDMTPGKVLTTDPRAVMRSASQNMRHAGHELRAWVRSTSESASTWWMEVLDDAAAIETSTGALVSCLLTVLWAPLEELEDAHSRGRSLLRARVAALIADFAANRERRKAIACAKEGRVVRWLLEQISREEPAVRHEAARALGHFLDDKRTAGAVLMQRGAVPQLLAYCDMLPRVQMLPPMRELDLEEEDLHDRAHLGQRLLVASLAKLVAGPDVSSWTRGIHLSPDADPADIASALAEMRSFERDADDEEQKRQTGVGDGDGNGGVQGIGIRVLGDTSIVGIQRGIANGRDHSMHLGESCAVSQCGVSPGGDRICVGVSLEEEERRSSHGRSSTSRPDLGFLFRRVLAEDMARPRETPVTDKVNVAQRESSIVLKEWPARSGPSGLGNFLLGGESSPALDEINLGGQLATWAVATWAAESPRNKERIAELDGDGGAIEGALRHPDPAVQFHAARAIKELATDETEWSESVAATWTPPLVGVLASTLFHDPAIPSRLSPGGVASSASMGAQALGRCAARSSESRLWLETQGLGVLRRLAADERVGQAVQKPLSGVVELMTGEGNMDKEEFKLWIPVLLRWTSDLTSTPDVRSSATAVLNWGIGALGPDGRLVMEAWLANLLTTLITKPKGPKPTDPHGILETETLAAAGYALDQLERLMARQAAAVSADVMAEVIADVVPEKRGWFSWGGGSKGASKGVPEAEVLLAVSAALKALAEVIAEDGGRQRRALEAGAYALLTQFVRSGLYGAAVSSQQLASAREGAGGAKEKAKAAAKVPKQKRPYVKRHALRVLTNLSVHPQLGALLTGDQELVDWLEEVADGRVESLRGDLKSRSFAKETLLHLAFWRKHLDGDNESLDVRPWPRYLDGVYLFNPTAEHFRTRETGVRDKSGGEGAVELIKETGAKLIDALSHAVGLGSGEESDAGKSSEARLEASRDESRDASERGSGNGVREAASEERDANNQSSGESSSAEASTVDHGASGEEIAPQDRLAAAHENDRDDRDERSLREGTESEQQRADAESLDIEAVNHDSLPRKDTSPTTGNTSARAEVPGAQSHVSNGERSSEAAVAANETSPAAAGASGARSPALSTGWDPLQGGPAPDVFIPLQKNRGGHEPALDVVFIHGLMGGPYKTWRMSEDKLSAIKAGGAVEDLGEEDRVPIGEGCWPAEWLANDLPGARLLSTEYKTNLTQWSGATLPLTDLSAHLLDKLVAAGVGERPVVFVTHSLGGLVAKQMLQLVRSEEKYRALGEQIRGFVFYSCPHFGSRLADLPSRMGVVLRPAAAVGELRSGSPRLEELNKLLRKEYQKGQVDIVSFSEDKVTPVVEAYYGYKLRMEVVPIESAYPGFGDLVVLKETDHVNACKPLDRQDIAYVRTLEFLKKMEADAPASKESRS